MVLGFDSLYDYPGVRFLVGACTLFLQSLKKKKMLLLMGTITFFFLADGYLWVGVWCFFFVFVLRPLLPRIYYEIVSGIIV